MRGTDEPYFIWEKGEPFQTHDNRWVYPFYTDGRGPDGSYAGHKIVVLDTDFDVHDPDIEYGGLGRHQVGDLQWAHKRVGYIGVDSADGSGSWGRQGIGTQMFRWAQSKDPGLKHALCADRVSLDGEMFVRATSPDEACNNHCGEGCRQRGPVEEAPPNWWARLLAQLGVGKGRR